VTEPLQRALVASIAPTTPAYPRNHRTVYRGHLFVGDLLLSDTGMRHHPLTPLALAADPLLASRLATTAVERIGAEPVFVDATADSNEVAAAQAALGYGARRHGGRGSVPRD
jgi:uncharacterized protein YgbK (DUF1537 family)